MEKIFFPSTKTSNRPSLNGCNCSSETFCLKSSRIFCVRPTAAGSYFQAAQYSILISIVLVCPLVRDNVSNTNGILINVYVKDTDPVYSVGCSAISATPYQDTWTQTTVVDSGSTFTGGNKTLLLPILTPLYNNGPINVVCTITGQNTTLFGYSVREYSPSDNEP